MSFRVALCLGLCFCAAVAKAAESPDHPGAAVYGQYCASCHDQGDVTRAPPLSALQLLNAESLLFALTEGVMQEQTTGMSRRELAVLIDYLALKEADSPDWYASIMCPAERREADLTAAATMPVVGIDLEGSRHLTAAAAGLSSADLGRLELAWAIGFPDTSALRSAPVIVGDTLFYTAPQTGRVLALDVQVPCVRWLYEAGSQVRSSIAYGEVDGRGVLVFADQRGQVHALTARDGRPLWVAEGRHSPNVGISGSPVLYQGTVIVPVSGSGVGRGANPEYECCSEHGAVVALDAATGEKRWTWHTMPDATYTGETNRVGVKLRGPSGAPIWSTPTIDRKRGLVFATSGQNTSLPATKTSDAVLAIDVETGKLRWGFQALADDVWIIGCREPWERSGPNCPSPEKSVLKDFDFGGSAILVQRPEGDILLAGQKSGDVWALDPDDGSLLWNQRFGLGTPLGGVHWGLAVDGKRVFAPISDPGRPSALEANTEGRAREPGMNALDIATGTVLWRQPLVPDCSPPRGERFADCDSRFGLSAVPLVVDASVIAGAVDGRLYIYDAVTGDVVFRYDTLRDFETLNGVAGKGGSIDAHSIAAGAGMVFVGSGYGRFGQPAGNVLLAFKPAKE
jgi:polyvinyl alcohol dehydrogenase (cytochrome)